jgi:hypothetical protein
MSIIELLSEAEPSAKPASAGGGEEAREEAAAEPPPKAEAAGEGA